jgi:ankyrin repeat protein
LAAREGDIEMARVLVNAGADVNIAAGDGKTALALAIFNGNYEVASFLVDNKADVNQGRRATVHTAVLGSRSPQHGNGAELSVDGDGRSRCR